jgi:hypothetical protein
MNADADVDLLGLFLLSVVHFELGLDLLRTLHSIHDRGEVHQERIADGFNDRAVVDSGGLLDDLIMQREQAQGAAFIFPIWRLKPTMSLNMMAARRRVSP